MNIFGWLRCPSRIRFRSAALYSLYFFSPTLHGNIHFYAADTIRALVLTTRPATGYSLLVINLAPLLLKVLTLMHCHRVQSFDVPALYAEQLSQKISAVE